MVCFRYEICKLTHCDCEQMYSNLILSLIHIHARRFNWICWWKRLDLCVGNTKSNRISHLLDTKFYSTSPSETLNAIWFQFFKCKINRLNSKPSNLFAGLSQWANDQHKSNCNFWVFALLHVFVTSSPKVLLSFARTPNFNCVRLRISPLKSATRAGKKSWNSNWNDPIRFAVEEVVSVVY